MNWYLKTNNTTYGPVDQAVLQRWAMDGRVTPEDQLSMDNTTWAPAPTIADLHMDWMLTLADGSPYGPLHILSLRDLVKEGSVSLHAKLTNKKTGEGRLVGEALIGALVEEFAQLQGRMESLNRRSPAPAQPAAEPAVDQNQEQITRLQQELEESRGKKTSDEAEIQRLQKEKEGLQAQIAALEQEKAQQVQQTQTEAREQSDEASELKQQLAQAQEENNRQTQALSEAKAFSQELQAQSDDLKKQLADLQQQLESAQRIISEMKEAAAAQPVPAPEALPSPVVQHERAQRLKDDESNFLLQKEIQRWKKLYDEERESSRRNSEQLNARIKEMRDNDLASHIRLEQTDLRLKQVEGNYSLLQKAMEDGISDQKLTAYVSALTESFTGLSQNYDNLMKQLADKSGELQSAVESRSLIQKEAQEQVERMEAVVRREEEEANRARLKLAEVEKGHFQLVQAFKDLSDRLIRMRQPMAPTTKTSPEDTALRESISGKETKSRIKLNR